MHYFQRTFLLTVRDFCPAKWQHPCGLFIITSHGMIGVCFFFLANIIYSKAFKQSRVLSIRKYQLENTGNDVCIFWFSS